LIVIGCFFTVYATFDAAASFDRAQLLVLSEDEDDIGVQTENVLVGLHTMYAAVLSIWSVAGILGSNGYAKRRLFMFIAFASGEIAVSFFTQVVCVQKKLFEFTVFPQMIYTIVHMVVAAFTLFLMRGESITEYVELDKEGGGDKIGVDRALNAEEGSGGIPDMDFRNEEEDIDTDVNK
jgi:hypothetical protein